MAHPYYTKDAQAPFAYGAAVVPSDAAGIRQTDALWIGAVGDVTFVGLDGVAVMLKAVPVGLLAIACTQVKATGTTATQIVALYRNQ